MDAHESVMPEMRMNSLNGERFEQDSPWRIGRIVSAFCFLLRFSRASHCHRSLADGTGTTYKTAYLHFQLNNCSSPYFLVFMLRSKVEFSSAWSLLSGRRRSETQRRKPWSADLRSTRCAVIESAA